MKEKVESKKKVDKNKNVGKKINKEKIEKEEKEKESNKKYWLLLLLLLLFTSIATVGLTYTFNENVRDKIDVMIMRFFKVDTPTAPKITADSKTWGKKQVVKVSKDAKSDSGIAYYEYCIESENNFDFCKWQKTTTKNMTIATTGKYYVVFRGVSNNGNSGKKSNVEEVWVDNESPNITSLKIENKEQGRAEVFIKAEDKESGIGKYYYKSNDGYQEVKEHFILETLEEGKEYEVTIKVEDKVGNSKEVSKTFIYSKKNTPDDDKCTINCDTDGDGKCDYNCDTEGDGKCDYNCEGNPSDNDNKDDDNKDDDNKDDDNKDDDNKDDDNKDDDNDDKCTINCDTNGDGKCDYNCDTDGDGKCDYYCDTNGDGKCDYNCEGNPSDKDDNDDKCTINCDTNGDGKCDYNCDTDDDGKCDYYCDTNGDGKCDYNCEGNPSDKDDDKDEDKDKDEVPIINLEKVPSEIEYGEKYELPSYVSFGKSNGVVQCIVEGKEYKDTSTIGIGDHLIVCTATSKENIKTTTTKEIKVNLQKGEDKVWDGWVKLNLTYPANSTNWQWRLGDENEIRTGLENDSWQDYTGPILVKITDVENIYIRYDLNGKTIIIPPKGRIVVDIEPEKYYVKDGEETLVKIIFDENSIKKEYRVGDGNWQDYTKEFRVGKNTIIEARATKEEKVYDSDGNYVYTKTIKGRDNVFVGEIIDDSTGGGGGGSSGGEENKDVEQTTLPDGTIVTKPKPEIKPSEALEKPEIIVAPSTLTEKVTVTIQAENAETIYVSENNGSYRKYTGSFEVTKNEPIRAYYISNDGRKSGISYYSIENIKQPYRPYVRINTDPSNYLTTDQKEVRVTLSGSDYDTLEYSFDGVIYSPYTEELIITESTTIYAKGTNKYGSTIERKNIITVNPPKEKEELTISIEANPESESLINKTNISITYDSKATKKYYKIGYNGKWQEYTGSFELRENTTIYAYATSPNGIGSEERQIDFLTTGISDPKIIATPVTQTPQVKISIVFDRQASTKKYKIGDGEFLDYNGPFYVYENTEITAYSKNILGMESESKYTVSNIGAPDYVIIDKGQYFILKLNYPKTSDENNREYKYKKDGIWKKYDSKGILLIKAEYKEELLKGIKDGIRVEDENGESVIFKDHYYILDMAIEDIMENIFMRWDQYKPEIPEILIEPEDATKEVEVLVRFDSSLVYKYYKIVTEDGNDTGWLKYTGSFKVDKNNAMIYAKGSNIDGIGTETARRKITNIDTEPPKIEIKGDLITPKRKITIYPIVTDDQGVEEVKFAKGEHDVSYFIENGTSIKGSFTVEENDKYTVYAIDKVGHETIKVIDVTNIDKNTPNIFINVLTETFGTKVEINIDYGDSIGKEYKIGSGEYQNYTDNLIISSYDVLNLKNEDGSLTIYARGTNEAGVQEEVSEQIYLLDLDAPAPPQIHISDRYPVLTEYGVTFRKDNYITFDETRNDIENYYSLDKGETWISYTGPIEVEEGEIWAKSVKKISGLEIISKTSLDIPSNALGPKAYDEDDETSEYIDIDLKRIDVSNEMQGRKLILTGEGSSYREVITMQFYNSSGTKLSQINLSELNHKWIGTKIINIPINTSYILFDTRVEGGKLQIKEIAPFTDPVISSEQKYPSITEYGVQNGYNEITIDYFQTTTQKLYKIDEGEWQTYQNNKIQLNLGETLYTKGIDKNGKETTTISYTTTLPNDALNTKAYDNDTETAENIDIDFKRIDVSSEMQGKKLSLTGKSSAYRGTVYMQFYDALGTKISQQGLGSGNKEWTGNNTQFAIPENTTYILFDSRVETGKLQIKEIGPFIDPVMNTKQVYPTLTIKGVEKGHNEIAINYFQTSVQRLYKIDEGEWQEYQDNTIRLEANQTLYTKGIDKNGKETNIISYKTTLPSDSLGTNAYDGNNDTAETLELKIRRINVSSELQGRKLLLTGEGSAYSTQVSMQFYDSSGTKLAHQNLGGWTKWTGTNAAFAIPAQTEYILFDSNVGSGKLVIKEIAPNINPEIKGGEISYPILTQYGVMSDNEISINYFPTSVQKLYKIDEGEWQEYQNKLHLNFGETLYAKGIDENGIETSIVSYKIKIPSDALGEKAYDGDESTSAFSTQTGTGGIAYINVSSDLWKKNIRITFNDKLNSSPYIRFLDINNQVISSINIPSRTLVIEVPEGTAKIKFDRIWCYLEIHEIGPNTTPIANVEKYYPTLTEYGVNKGYDELTLTYFPTSVEKLYRINGGEWQNYHDEKIRLEIGDKLEAKGIDKYEKEGYTLSYTAKLISDAFGLNAYDGDKETAYVPPTTDSSYVKLKIDETMKRKIIKVTTYGNANRFQFYDKDLKKIGSELANPTTFEVPENAEWLYYARLRSGSNSGLYEIVPSKIPVIVETNYYPEYDGTKLTQAKYVIQINFVASVPGKKYSLDKGVTWLDYEGPFEVEAGTIVQAKSVDATGADISVVSHTVSTLNDAIKAKVFDNNKETTMTVTSNTRVVFNVTKELQGKTIRIFTTNVNANDSILKIKDKENNELQTISLTNQVNAINIPENSYEIIIKSGSNNLILSEIDIRPEVEKQTLQNPNIAISDIGWNTSKGIDIVYPNGYINEYSLDYGETWTLYTENITITEATTILARCVDTNGKVVASSSFKITKIAESDPEETQPENTEETPVPASNIEQIKEVMASKIDITGSRNRKTIIKSFSKWIKKIPKIGGMK